MLFGDRESGELRVRLRASEDEDEGEEDMTEEPEEAFLSRVIEALVAYEPPTGKKQSIQNRSIPEPVWVPARAILNARERVRLEECISRCSCLAIASSSDDGLLLHLKRHPRAPDSAENLRRCVSELQKISGIEEEEAERRLRGDEKFEMFLNALDLVEKLRQPFSMF